MITGKYLSMAKTAFPMVMVVLCAASYFAFWDGPVAPEAGLAPADSVSKQTRGEPSGARDRAQELTVPAEETPAVSTGHSTARSTPDPSLKAGTIALVSGTDAREETPYANLQMIASSSDLVGDQSIPFQSHTAPPDENYPGVEGNLSAESSLRSRDPRESRVAEQTPTVAGGLARSEKIIIDNSDYEQTSVSDYWVGLARATEAEGTRDLKSPTQVIDNPFAASPVDRSDRTDSQQLGPSAMPASIGRQSSWEQPTKSDLWDADAPTEKTSAVRPDAAAQEPQSSPRPELALPGDWSGTLLDNAPRNLPVESLDVTAPAADAATMTAETSMPIQSSQRPAPVELPPVSDAIRQQVHDHWQYGSSLARRNALHLSKQEFYGGLSLLAEHADQAFGSQNHLNALQEGFLALEEAGDFESTQELRPGNLDVIVTGHKTPLLKDGYFQASNHSQARQAFLLYSRERLRVAVGAQPLAGELLYSLGKLYLAAFELNRAPDPLDLSRATMLFEAGLNSDPTHAKCANELAVIRAKNGDWAAAKSLLQLSVRWRPDFLEAWENLVKVHRRLGEQQFEALAAEQVNYLKSQNIESSMVRMVSNAEFAATPAAMEGGEDSTNTSTGSMPGAVQMSSKSEGRTGQAAFDTSSGGSASIRPFGAPAVTERR
jgi:tetratricopeptide (TPR) repeat protein